MQNEPPKKSSKNLDQQIDVVAQFHAHKIHPLRIAYRTGIDITLIEQLINGEAHPAQFRALLGKHRKNRRDQRLKKSLRIKGIAQSDLQDKIEQEYVQSIIKPI